MLKICIYIYIEYFTNFCFYYIPIIIFDFINWKGKIFVFQEFKIKNEKKISNENVGSNKE